MKHPVKEPNKLEEAAEEMRLIVKDARRKLLEFEIMMSMNEIKEGKIESYETVDKLLKDLK